MAKLIHTADLHIKRDEKAYCYAVLDEIIAHASAEKADFLVIAGDLFDSFADFEALRKEAAAKFEPLVKDGCRIIYIPGNHEARGAAADLAAFSLDNMRYCARQPFDFFELAGVEFLTVPHAANYDGYRDWKVPPKKPGMPRVAVLHALNSTIYTGPDDEADSKAGVIEDDFFSRFDIDYAAMGHVHAGRQQQLGGAVVCYPGSPRVWRAHIREAGPKTVTLADLACSPVTARQLPVNSAGQFREYTVPVGIDGAVPAVETQKIEASSGGRDFVRIRLTGVVEDENAALAAADKLRERLALKVRGAEVKLETTVTAALSDNSLAKAFLAELEAIKPEDEDCEEYRRWLLARQYGLEEIAAHAGEAA
jgi:DNA repair exonuclease SbcCD nuclease subunit